MVNIRLTIPHHECIYGNGKIRFNILKLNGAELPCGSVLTVEPADMNYKETLRNRSIHTAIDTPASAKEKKAHNETNSTKQSSPLCPDEEENLDEFFASLE